MKERDSLEDVAFHNRIILKLIL